MTKVQRRFRLKNTLDESLMQQIADAHSIYGIERIMLSGGNSEITVEFDATRLTAGQVESALRSAGIPVEAV
ncbi:MAG: hypothetical protein JWN34_680 [Bryobacterales bacterium]|nr:hypothetical protein [Bryobacterales bacterium]